jgi:hypothetical protein
MGLLKIALDHLDVPLHDRGNKFLLHPGFSDATESLFDQRNQFFVIETAGSDHTEVSANVSFAHEIEHLLSIYIGNRLTRTDHRHAKWMTGPEAVGKLVVNRFLRAVLDHGDLLEDNPTFLLYVIKIEPGMTDQIAKQINRHRQLFGEDFDKVAAVFPAGETIEEAANGIDFAGDSLGAAPVGAFEEHMFNEVGDAVEFSGFMTGAVIHPDTE